MPAYTKIFELIEKAVKEQGADLVKMGGAIFQIVVSDGGPDGKICVDLSSGNGATSRGDSDKADVTISLADADLAAMADGSLDGVSAFMSGKLKIKGNMMLAQKLGPILEAAKP
mmetsp:Transcript_31940/g.74788  ORF Transcript_31940/g.74788 Transcript_31940/m.74788 type:complete len:114 (-) Transcript_31940:139-480(-)|eukprot:CAMPEP_0178402280 /NCGR_PEP_ID=MMETSP0689_2-20121128/16753_1 /TAXON_ID=160604 /ORGANISM="Amphidinium massartii, Strain CS-259" /LENGTH=113 /DNA_ID=CAMNT_0020023161 /DNA_START=98 /DNA_END=439 /DNA_ORIENTATION=-